MCYYCRSRITRLSMKSHPWYRYNNIYYVFAALVDCNVTVTLTPKKNYVLSYDSTEIITYNCRVEGSPTTPSVVWAIKSVNYDCQIQVGYSDENCARAHNITFEHSPLNDYSSLNVNQEARRSLWDDFGPQFSIGCFHFTSTQSETYPTYSVIYGMYI